MERFLKQYDKEYMKMALLKHEETFRQQVHELHRLYRVQKLLMRDMKNTKSAIYRSALDRRNGLRETGSRQPFHSLRDQRRRRRILDLELPAEECMGDAKDAMHEIGQESDIELTLSLGSRWMKREETSSDSGTSFSSSSTESGGVKLTAREWALHQMEDVNINFHGESKNPFDVEEGSREDGLKHPPWLFQSLTLKMV